MIALGDERTIQQDPAFAIRIMVDIALMALSPAVNAPTTATQVLGHLGETLRMIGATDLGRAGSAPVDDPPAVVIRTPLWEDYLALGVTEIRLYGASGVQVMRKLRATLEALREDVRVEHRAAVEDELAASIRPSRRTGADRSISTLRWSPMVRASAAQDLRREPALNLSRARCPGVWKSLGTLIGSLRG